MKKYTWWKLRQIFGEPWNGFTDILISLVQKTQIDLTKRPIFPRKMDGGFYTWAEIQEFHKRMMAEREVKHG